MRIYIIQQLCVIGNEDGMKFRNHSGLTYQWIQFIVAEICSVDDTKLNIVFPRASAVSGILTDIDST